MGRYLLMVFLPPVNTSVCAPSASILRLSLNSVPGSLRGNRQFHLMQTPRFVKIIMVLAVMTGCAWLLYLMDDGLGICWTHNVVRNWEEFGFFNLHGKLVTNPGGFEVATHPEIYPGHQPMSLYPAFICKKLFSCRPGACFCITSPFRLLFLFPSGICWEKVSGLI